MNDASDQDAMSGNLPRSIDPSGAKAWGAALGQHVDHAVIAARILASNEAIEEVVQNAYQQFLLRSADAGGLSFWMNNLQHGMSDETLIASLVASDEFSSGA